MNTRLAAAAVTLIAVASPAFADPALASWSVDILSNADVAAVREFLFAPFEFLGDSITTAGDWVVSAVAETLKA